MRGGLWRPSLDALARSVDHSARLEPNWSGRGSIPAATRAGTDRFRSHRTSCSSSVCGLRDVAEFTRSWELCRGHVGTNQSLFVAMSARDFPKAAEMV